MANDASFNVPEYYGQPKEAALVWLLTKGTKRARCSLWTASDRRRVARGSGGRIRAQ
jgi:hypothetical protein